MDSKVSENLESCDVFIFLSYVSQANVHEQKPMDKHINTLTNTHRIHTHLKYILFQICTPCYPLMHTQTHTHTKTQRPGFVVCSTAHPHKGGKGTRRRHYLPKCTFPSEACCVSSQLSSIHSVQLWAYCASASWLMAVDWQAD